MAAKYRKVDPRVWDDVKFRSLDRDGKLLALWLLTGNRINRCGIAIWSPGLASEDTGIPLVNIQTVCHTVCHTLTWVEDPEFRTIFLRRWWRYNCPPNLKALFGALSDLHDVPLGPITQEALVAAAQDVRANLRKQYLVNIQTVCHTVSIPYRVGIGLVSHQKQKQKQKQNIDIVRDGCTDPGLVEVLLEFPLKSEADGRWGLTADKLAEYRQSYPHLDVLDQLRRARQWLLDNPGRRKTRRGMDRFLGAWLDRQQDRGRGGQPGRPPEGPVYSRPKSIEELDAEERERMARIAERRKLEQQQRQVEGGGNVQSS